MPPSRSWSLAPALALALALALSAASAASVSVGPTAALLKSVEEDPDCPEPELGGRDIVGAAAARFAPGAFSLDGGGGVPAVPARPAVRAMLRAPVHTCRIKLSPGLREWIKTKGALFGEELVAVQAFSQPPSLLFVDGAGVVFEHVEIGDDATVADITSLLRSRGIVSAASDALDAPAPPVFDQDAAARAADAFKPERDMEIAMALRTAQAELAAARAELAAARAAAEASGIALASGRLERGEHELARLQAELAAADGGAAAAGASLGIDARSGDAADMREL